MDYQSKKISVEMNGPADDQSRRSALLTKVIESLERGGAAETTSFIKSELSRFEQLYTDKLKELRENL